MYVHLTPEDVASARQEFDQAGLHGCFASSDGTHVISERIHAALKNNHLGGKSSHTTRAYNMTVTHRRRILGSSLGYPGRWNDKTLQRFDKLLEDLHEGKILQDEVFELLDHDERGNVITVKYKGLYVAVDNGYLTRAETMPPIKNEAETMAELRWSKWLESMRKDVECAFGIMKGRFRILKSGIRLHGVEIIDDIWFTCCALHNWLLEVDGLDAQWTQGVRSDWEGELGQFETGDVERFMPAIIARMNSTNDTMNRGANLQNYDTSGMGHGEPGEQDEADGVHDTTDDNIPDGSATGRERVVRHLNQDYFRKKLIKHFSILWGRNQVSWPSRNGQVMWVAPDGAAEL